MASNEGHVHWSGATTETVVYLDQVLEITSEMLTADQALGALHIHAEGFAGTPLFLPNSSNSDPQWDPIPGTSPVLEARQDGHYPTGFIRVRMA